MTKEYHLLNQVYLVFGASILAGSNINIAHELVHKENNFIDHFLGTATLAKNYYMHFAIEHIYGHHRNVATPCDPATSKKGQTVY